VIEHRSLLEVSLSKDKSLSCVIEQLVIWDYILVELSLEVQGGQDYFRFVEGTCIIACVLSSSVLYIYPLHIDSELTQTLNYFRLWTWGQLSRTWKKKFPKTQFNPPFLWFFSPSQRLQQCYCYLCLVVETKIAEMVVAEFVAVHFVHCHLSTLVK